MKVLSKKKFKEEAGALKHLSDKYGKKFEVVKPNKSRWLCMPAAPKELVLKPWKEFVEDYKTNNPGLSHAEALKAASPVYKALQEAQQEQKAA